MNIKEKGQVDYYILLRILISLNNAWFFQGVM